MQEAVGTAELTRAVLHREGSTHGRNTLSKGWLLWWGGGRGPAAQVSLMSGTSETLPMGQRENLHLWTKKLQGRGDKGF